MTNLTKRLVLATSGVALLAALFLVRIPARQAVIDYAALARIDLEPFHQRLSAYRTEHGGSYPRSLAEVSLDESHGIEYHPPKTSLPDKVVFVGFWSVKEYKKARTVFGITEQVVLHRFGLQVDGSVVEIAE